AARPPRRGMTPPSGVAITGVGIVSAAVTGDSAALGAFLAAPVAPPDTAFGAGALAALVDPDEARRLSRVCQLTVTAARLALRESGLERDAALGLVVGTEFGDLGSTHAFADGFLARGPAGLSALLFPNTVMNTMIATAAPARGAPVLGEVSAAAWRALRSRPWGVGRARRSQAIEAVLRAAGAQPGDVGWVYASGSDDEPRDRWEEAVLDAALPDGPPVSSLGRLLGRHAGLGVLRVAAAAWTARSGLLPVVNGTAHVARVRPGRGLVHGLARGGAHVALLVDAA